MTTEKFLINGQEFEPEDVEFDSVEEPREKGPVIDGEEAGYEVDEPAQDQALYGKN